jgi:transglutaminase-like putative cysteine protease
VQLRYYAADLNADQSLSWAELARFQERLVSDIRYAGNATALSPDELFAAGEGDCEDFALFTCGLLRYWGVECYLGSFSGDGSSTGHAVALIPVDRVPDGYTYFEVDSERLGLSGAVPSGTYGPVDYEYVGGLSSAVERGWTLRWVRVPEETYGLGI